VIPPGVDADTLAIRAEEEIPGRLEGTPRFLSVARQSEEKGIDILLEALPAVLEEFPEAVLTLAGIGPALDDNKRLAASLGVAEHVSFMGLTANPAPYFRDADVVVLPSRREGLPVVALEAFALARPVVATSVGGTIEAVIDGETGWIVPPEDPQRLARALIEAVTDRDEASRRALRGQQLVHERFTSDRMVGRLETLACEVAHRRLLTPPERSRSYYRGVRAYQAARLASARARGRGTSWEGVRIFGYHRVADDGDVFAVGVTAFREHMEALLASDATPLRLEAALDLLEQPVEGRYACITFDDGYLDTLENAAPILRELGIPATVFIPTRLIDAQLGFHWHKDSPPALSWDDLKALTGDGLFDVQAHSRLHPKLTALSDEAAWEEIAGSKADLEQRLPYPVTSFCYPAGFSGNREMEMVLRAGYRAGLTTKAGINPGGEAQEWAALRRTMIYWDDERGDFEGKLEGLLDRPSRLQRIVRHSRTRRPLPAV
jgi:peptidoglycan/xylan/chitin deacetylase (PgdA/CDA1 family)